MELFSFPVAVSSKLVLLLAFGVIAASPCSSLSWNRPQWGHRFISSLSWHNFPRVFGASAHLRPTINPTEDSEALEVPDDVPMQDRSSQKFEGSFVEQQIHEGALLQDQSDELMQESVSSSNDKLHSDRIQPHGVGIQDRLNSRIRRGSARSLLATEDSVDEPVAGSDEQLVLQKLEQQQQQTGKRLVIGITPTYPRAFQTLYFNHLVAALRSAGPPFLWLVIEGWRKTEETTKLLERTAGLCLPFGDPECETVTYIHITCGKNESSRWNKAVVQRNAGLDFIQQHKLDGTVYFMDDDNTYNPLLFEELRKIRRVGVFPVGFLFSVEFGVRNPWLQHHPTVERPLVRRREDPAHPAGPLEVYGWETFEWSIPKKHGGAPRTYCTDMAGFAFNSQLLWTKLDNVPEYPKHPVRFVPVSGGYLETTFLGKLLPGIAELEPVCNEARQVLVWHTHGEAEKWYRYPGEWKLPQPQDLVLITTEGTTWNYAIGSHRYGIRGRRDTDLRPGYKETGVPAPPARVP